MGKKKSSGSAKQVNISSQDRQFNSHISYLFKQSYLNILNFDQEFCRNSLKLIKKLTNKKSVKLSPDLKYFHCKNCDIMLIPDLTSRIRINSNRSKHVVNTCLACGAIKRFNLNQINSLT